MGHWVCRCGGGSAELAVEKNHFLKNLNFS